jgi:hypothetical protein
MRISLVEVSRCDHEVPEQRRQIRQTLGDDMLHIAFAL